MSSYKFIPKQLLFLLKTKQLNFSLKNNKIPSSLSISFSTMKLIEDSKLQINQPCKIKIIPEEQDDLWLLSNLLSPGDIVCAESSRKIHNASVGGKNSIRVRFDMEVKIHKIDYNNTFSCIRASGKIMTNNSYVNAGVYHTLELEINKAFDLYKKGWDVKSIKNLKDACKNKCGCDLVVLLVNKESAQLYLVGKSSTNLCATIDAPMGRKKYDPTKFFQGIIHVLTKKVDFSVVHCLMIGGNGTTKVEFKQFLLSQMSKVKNMEGIRSRVGVVDVDSMGKEGLSRVLGDPKVMNMIKDSKSATEVKAMKELNEMLLFHPDKACYGPKSVDLANELLAIETLLVTDDLFRNRDNGVRKKYMTLVDSVKKSGGKALVLSTMHISGEQLAQLTGVAAILRFPVPNLDDLEL